VLFIHQMLQMPATPFPRLQSLSMPSTFVNSKDATPLDFSLFPVLDGFTPGYAGMENAMVDLSGHRRVEMNLNLVRFGGKIKLSPLPLDTLTLDANRIAPNKDTWGAAIQQTKCVNIIFDDCMSLTPFWDCLFQTPSSDGKSQPHLRKLVMRNTHDTSRAAFCRGMSVEFPRCPSVTHLTLHNIETTISPWLFPKLRVLVVHGGTIKFVGEFLHLHSMTLDRAVLRTIMGLSCPQLRHALFYQVEGLSGIVFCTKFFSALKSLSIFRSSTNARAWTEGCIPQFLANELPSGESPVLLRLDKFTASVILPSMETQKSGWLIAVV